MNSSTYLTVARVDVLPENAPAHAEADGIDLVVVRRGETVHVSRDVARIEARSSRTDGWRART